MITATPVPANELKNSNNRRSSQSANAPEKIPRKKNGAICAAAATPTMKADPVISKTSQPTATRSIPMPRE